MLSRRLLLSSLSLFLTRVLAQQSSIPIATSPIVITTTIPTVVESLTTSLSESTSVSNADTVLTATATDSDGNTSIFVSTAISGGAQAQFVVTVTDVQTIQVSTNTVIVSTIGSTTIFGPDTAATSTPPTSTPTSTPASPTSSSTPPLITSTLVTSVSPRSSSLIVPQPSTDSSPTSTSTFAIASATPSLTSNAPSSSSKPSKSLSTGAKVGIALACIAAFALISFVIWFVIRRRIDKENDPYMPSPSEKKMNNKKGGKGAGAGFVYDPEDTSYLDAPYKEVPGSAPGSAPAGGWSAGTVGGQRYEMQDNNSRSASPGVNRFGGSLSRGPRRPVRPEQLEAGDGGGGGHENGGGLGVRMPGWGRGPLGKG